MRLNSSFGHILSHTRGCTSPTPTPAPQTLTSHGIIFRQSKIVCYSLYICAAFFRHCFEFSSSRWFRIEDVRQAWHFGSQFFKVRRIQTLMVLCATILVSEFVLVKLTPERYKSGGLTRLFFFPCFFSLHKFFIRIILTIVVRGIYCNKSHEVLSFLFVFN